MDVYNEIRKTLSRELSRRGIDVVIDFAGTDEGIQVITSNFSTFPVIAENLHLCGTLESDAEKYRYTVKLDLRYGFDSRPLECGHNFLVMDFVLNADREKLIMVYTTVTPREH